MHTSFHSNVEITNFIIDFSQTWYIGDNSLVICLVLVSYVYYHISELLRTRDKVPTKKNEITKILQGWGQPSKENNKTRNQIDPFLNV